MSLIGKEPVDKPCEAETFEEAARKNRARLMHERDLCKDLHEQMKRDREGGLEATDPLFWVGAVGANDQAFRIYQEELKAFQKRVADRIDHDLQEPPNPSSPVFASGWKSIRESWAKALRKDDPSIIVYW